jgi:hypothetical protein
MFEKETKIFRVTCRDDAGEITLRTGAKDQYDAFERVSMFLRKKEFDYQIVLVEFCRSILTPRRAGALR